MEQSDSDPPANPRPRVSSEDLDGDMPIPDPDDSRVVQVVSGKGFQIVDCPSQKPEGIGLRGWDLRNRCTLSAHMGKR
jgi:hypothetical protein